MARRSRSTTLEQLRLASVVGQLSVPIYQGGAEYSAIRQAKETLGQRRIDLDTAREQVRQTVVQSWGQLEAAKAKIEATQAQVRPPKSRSTACARRRGSASAPRSTCSTRSRNW